MSSKSKNRTSSSLRRSASIRRKKPLSPGPSRGHVSIRGKRPPSRGTYDDERRPPKRSRSPRNRTRSLSRQSSSETRWNNLGITVITDQIRGSQQRIDRNNERDRFSPNDTYLIDKPTTPGQDIDLSKNRDSLKKIVIKMRESPTGNSTIKRDVINLENIHVVRHAGEGSRPIFDRHEIVNYVRDFEETDRERKRANSRSPAPSARRRSSADRFRFRVSYEERGERFREYPRGRQGRDHDSRPLEGSRDERSSHQSSTKKYSPERNYRCDGRDDRRSYRRSPGSLRRRPSPRRHPDNDRPVRHRSPERVDQSPEMNDERSRGRGRGRGFSIRGRGLSGSRSFLRPAEIIMHPARPVRPVNEAFLPRLPRRRLPFPPRLVRSAPVIAPVIRVMAPVIPIRPSLVPVRPSLVPLRPSLMPVRPPVLPVRHPVLPPPF